MYNFVKTYTFLFYLFSSDTPQELLFVCPILFESLAFMDVVIIVFAFILLAIVFDTQSQGDHLQGKNISAGMQGLDNGQ